jgi:hypothetical protein
MRAAIESEGITLVFDEDGVAAGIVRQDARINLPGQRRFTLPRRALGQRLRAEEATIFPAPLKFGVSLK